MKNILLSLFCLVCFSSIIKAQDFRDNYVGTYICTKNYCTPCSSAYNIKVYISKDLNDTLNVIVNDSTTSSLYGTMRFVAFDSIQSGSIRGKFYSNDSLYILRPTFQTAYIEYFCAKIGGGPTSISDKQYVENNFEIYPNPTFEKLYIKQNVIEDFEIALFDITGRQVNEIIKGKNLTEISVADLDEGIYFVQIKSGKGIISKRIIINYSHL